ncbi:MAG: carbohydrate-binding domain-containing protein, partial [Lachnospiraceae bacterium]|nr:carbohydrate-binding domain-containing protein [Lachnospiraceae bacterium]
QSTQSVSEKIASDELFTDRDLSGTYDESQAVAIHLADKASTCEGGEVESNGEFVAIDENDIDATVFSKDDLTLNGTGSLKVTCESGHGIVSKDDLKLTGGTYEISCALDALSGNDSVRIADGAITIDAGDDGIHSDADLIIVGGTININDSYEGLEGQTITIDGGNIALSASDDGLNAAGGNDQSGFGGGMCGGDKDKQQMMQDGDTFKKGGFGSRDGSAWNGMEPPQN